MEICLLLFRIFFSFRCSRLHLWKKRSNDLQLAHLGILKSNSVKCELAPWVLPYTKRALGIIEVALWTNQILFPTNIIILQLWLTLTKTSKICEFCRKYHSLKQWFPPPNATSFSKFKRAKSEWARTIMLCSFSWKEIVEFWFSALHLEIIISHRNYTDTFP